jgi:CDP-paratose 2-epimerase
VTKILITGGAGFIGSNLAEAHLKQGDQVTVFDNLSRAGVSNNLDWLKENCGENLTFVKGDVRDINQLKEVVPGQDRIYHLASQVAVTTSVTDPMTDFEINAGGTVNMLVAVKETKSDPVIVFTSTNKVYGGMEGVNIVEEADYYRYADYPDGIPETYPLDFHSPYGCSKGAADQYIRDFARIYGIRSVVFRMSCIYGIRQFGCEDQGWIAHFVISAILGKKINKYGDGKQVRDVLFAEDLVRAFQLASENIDKTAGQVYNIGGGAKNAIPILKVFDILDEYGVPKQEIDEFDWRPGDQKIYVSDTGKFEKTTGWKAEVSVKEGVKRLYDWLMANQHMFKDL